MPIMWPSSDVSVANEPRTVAPRNDVVALTAMPCVLAYAKPMPAPSTESGGLPSAFAAGHRDIRHRGKHGGGAVVGESSFANDAPTISPPIDSCHEWPVSAFS